MNRSGEGDDLSYPEKRNLLEFYRAGWDIQLLASRFKISIRDVFSFLHSRKEPLRQKDVGRAGTGEVRRAIDEAGIIVTLRRQDTLELHSMHIPGRRTEAIQHMCKLIDHSGIDWRLLCYSTPLSITSDLEKRRVIRPTSTLRNMPAYLGSPEASALGQVKRLDLLDPKIDTGPRRT